MCMYMANKLLLLLFKKRTALQHAQFETLL